LRIPALSFLSFAFLVRSIPALLIAIICAIVADQISDPNSKSSAPTILWLVFVALLIYVAYGLLNRSITITTNSLTFTSVACCTEAGSIVEAIWPNMKPRAQNPAAMVMPPAVGTAQ
jgi:hypothetical protein